MYKKIIIGFLVACIFSGFSDISFADLEVSINKDTEKDFNQYKTFAWLPQDLWMKHLKKQPHEGMYRVITEAVNKDLIAKGYSEVPFEEADLVVVYTGSIEQKESVSKAGFGHKQEYFGARVRINQFGNVRSIPASVWDDRAYTSYYTEGKFILDFYDRKTKTSVWRATGIKNVELDSPVIQIEEKKVAKSINTIMEKFPETQKAN